MKTGSTRLIFCSIPILVPKTKIRRWLLVQSIRNFATSVIVSQKRVSHSRFRIFITSEKSQINKRRKVFTNKTCLRATFLNSLPDTYSLWYMWYMRKRKVNLKILDMIRISRVLVLAASIREAKQGESVTSFLRRSTARLENAFHVINTQPRRLVCMNIRQPLSARFLVDEEHRRISIHA